MFGTGACEKRANKLIYYVINKKRRPFCAFTQSFVVSMYRNTQRSYICYNTSFVYCRELVPGTVSFTCDWSVAPTVNNIGIIDCSSKDCC